MKKKPYKEMSYKPLVLWFLLVFIVLVCLTLLYLKKYEDGLFWMAVVSIVCLVVSAEIIKFYLSFKEK